MIHCPVQIIIIDEVRKIQLVINNLAIHCHERKYRKTEIAYQK